MRDNAGFQSNLIEWLEHLPFWQHVDKSTMSRSRSTATSYPHPNGSAAGQEDAIALSRAVDGALIMMARPATTAECSLSGEKSVLSLLDRWPSTNVALRDPEETGLASTCTYGQLRGLVQRESNVIRGLGLKTSDVVAYVVDEGPMSAALFLTVSSSCVAAPLSVTSSKLELKQVMMLAELYEALAPLTRPLVHAGI